MTTKITTVIDTIRTTVPTLTGFTTKTEIPNPYSLTDNSKRFLCDGWGLSIGSASSSFNEFKSFFEERDFTITLTKQVFRTSTDADAYQNAAKTLLEDMITIKRDFLNNDQLAIPTSIGKIDLGTSSGIDFIPFGDKLDFLTISTTFLVTIIEDII